jgi:Cu/Zn superoxide dismutase
MKRLAVVVAAAAFLSITGVAGARENGDAYRTHLAPVVAGATTPSGTAILVDSKKTNLATIHVMGLTPGTRYPWHVHEFPAGSTNPCAAGAAQGPIVSSFTFGPLTGDSRGDGVAIAESKSFNWGSATHHYYVNVHNPTTLAPIACGVLR